MWAGMPPAAISRLGCTCVAAISGAGGWQQATTSRSRTNSSTRRPSMPSSSNTIPSAQAISHHCLSCPKASASRWAWCRRKQEDQGQLLRRIEDAARYCPLEQLSLSAQCGFASRRRRQRANRGPAMGQAGAGRRHGTARLGSTIVADPYHRQAVGIEPVPLHPFWGMVLRVWLN
jgi:hypothetical protein